MQLTGQTAIHGASVQCMHATETDRSPGRPSLSVTTLRRLTPHGTSFSFLHAVTQALQSMQRSTSHKNRILAMSVPRGRPKGLTAPPWGSERSERGGRFILGPRYLAQADLRLLHHRHGVVTIGPRRVHRLAGDDGRGAFGILVADDLSLPPAGEVVRHEHETRSDPRRDECAYLDARAGGRRYPNVVVRLQTAVVRVG